MTTFISTQILPLMCFNHNCKGKSGYVHALICKNFNKHLFPLQLNLFCCCKCHLFDVKTCKCEKIKLQMNADALTIMQQLI